jgi:hypothetical protein
VHLVFCSGDAMPLSKSLLLLLLLMMMMILLLLLGRPSPNCKSLKYSAPLSSWFLARGVVTGGQC